MNLKYLPVELIAVAILIAVLLSPNYAPAQSETAPPHKAIKHDESASHGHMDRVSQDQTGRVRMALAEINRSKSETKALASAVKGNNEGEVRAILARHRLNVPHVQMAPNNPICFHLAGGAVICIELVNGHWEIR